MISEGKARLDLIHYGEETSAENFKYKGEVNRVNNRANGYGVGTCISDPNMTITGTFKGNKPDGFCK